MVALPKSGTCVEDGDAGGTRRFVVNEHYATTHHFDLRLERSGTLWSWALPKGPPIDPAQNRLAVRVDDHGIEHLGVVDPSPVSGVAGAIAKSIWDSGTYRTVRSAPDKLVVDFAGSRLNGRFALFRTDGSNWMMHLMAPDPADQPTGRTEETTR